MWERVMKMKIEIRNDTAVVSGYVNAVGRDSRPITDKDGKLFIEQIEPGAFRASLERSENVDLLLNHNKSKVYASTKDGSLKLTEDSIGLRAEAVLSDADMIRKARSGEFRGWSFGMYVGDSTKEERAEGIPRRHVKSLNMFEVSLIDKSRIPCYVGTSVECRAEGEDVLAELRYSEEEPEIVEEERSEPESVDYSAVDNVISKLRYGALDNVIAELRYNPYHDPSNGRFCSGGGGGGGGVLVVEQGQKGKGVYIVDVDHDEEYEKWKAEKQNGNDAFAELPEEPLYKYGTKDLPQLTGSAEEIKEAKKIRSKTLKDAQYYALTKLSDGRPSDLYITASRGKQAMIDSINNSALVKATWDPNVKQQKISDRVASYKDTYARNQRFGDILSQTSAKFWLDHDTNTPKNYMNLHFKDYIDGKTKL